MKHIISIFASTALMLASCDRAFELDLPLAVDSHRLSIGQEEGTTHILVYADGPWTASFDTDLTWATLDRTSGDGNSEVVFSYSENFGIARQARLVLTKGDLKETVHITQSGPVISPAYKFESASHSLAIGGGTAVFYVSGNLEHSLDAIRVAAVYEKDGEPVPVTGGDTDPDHWITSAQPFADHLMLEIDYNVMKVARSADIVVTIDDPTGRTMRSIMTLTQTADKPVLQFASISGTYGKAAATAVAKCTRNNVYAYEADTIIRLPADAEWLSNVRLTSEGLEFTMEENLTGKLRSAIVNITYIDSFAAVVKAGYTVVQKAE